MLPANCDQTVLVCEARLPGLTAIRIAIAAPNTPRRADRKGVAPPNRSRRAAGTRYARSPGQTASAIAHKATNPRTTWMIRRRLRFDDSVGPERLGWFESRVGMTSLEHA